MDKVEKYNKIACELVEQIALWSSSSKTIETMSAIDTVHGQYLLLSDGWLNNDTRVYGPLIHIEVKQDGKVWLRHDGTDLEIGQQLLDAGIASSDLVPAFYSPTTRQYTGYAVA
jgi:XisI protein